MSLLGRIRAGGYDLFMDRMDRAGGEWHRRRLAEKARDEVLEVGAGTGKNLPLYGAASRVVALEPDPAKRARALGAAREARARGGGGRRRHGPSLRERFVRHGGL